jgi:MFS family permease
MLRLLLERPFFRRLWLASTLSLLGDWLSFVAVSLLALNHGGGPLALAVVLAVHALPHALLSPLAGAIADRFDRRRLLLGAALVQAALTTAMALAALGGDVILVQALVLARGAVGAFVVPAETAALRRVIEEDELIAANAMLSSTWSITFVVGMALGGAIAALGPAAAMLLDAISFLAAAALTYRLPSMKPIGREQDTAPKAMAILRAVPSDMGAALQRAWARPELFRAVFTKAPIALAGGGGWVVLHLIAGRAVPLGSAALSIGLLQAVRGAGTGIGPAWMMRMIRRGRSEAFANHLAAGMVFASIGLFVMSNHPIWLLAIALFWGMGSGSNWVLSSSALQKHAPDRFIGRLASLDELAMTAAQVGGALLAAVIAERFGSVAAAAWVSVGLGAAAWVGITQRGGADEAEEIAAAPVSLR